MPHRPRDRRDALARYEAVFLKQSGEIRERLISKTAAAARGAGCDAAAILGAEAAAGLATAAGRGPPLILRDSTSALARLGGALLREYDAAKRLRGVLDFDDLVANALALLRRPGVAPWVLFKLDGGLDHILIDEAQDTNPEQWEIVAALAEEFFSGEGARRRTPDRLCGRRRKAVDLQFSACRSAGLSGHAGAFRSSGSTPPIKPGIVVPLDVSFRSTEAVLQAVDMIFDRDRKRATG